MQQRFATNNPRAEPARGSRGASATINRCSLSTRFVCKVGLLFLSQKLTKKRIREESDPKKARLRERRFFCGEKAGAEWYATPE